MVETDWRWKRSRYFEVVDGILQVTMCGWFWMVRLMRSGSRTLTPSWTTPRSWHWQMEIASQWHKTVRLYSKYTTLTMRLLLPSLAMEWCSSAHLLLTGDRFFRCWFFTPGIVLNLTKRWEWFITWTVWTHCNDLDVLVGCVWFYISYNISSVISVFLH